MELMGCPTCGTDLMGLGRWCHECERYTDEMEVTSLELTLPLPPNVANARMHWAKKSRTKKAYRDECAVLIGSVPTFEVPVTLTATLYVWNLMDNDNLTARLKWTQDALVWADVIHDDSPRYLTLGTVDQKIDRKRPRVEIRLEAA